MKDFHSFLYIGNILMLIAEQVITQLKIKHADLVVDEFNLFEDDLPAFDKNAVGAKMALFVLRCKECCCSKEVR
jgi:hypothetical protein